MQAYGCGTASRALIDAGMTVPAVIYHLARRADWAAGQAAGEYRAPSLDAEGFIHASGDEAQLLRVAARLFAGSADLLALEVATARLDGSVRR